MKKTLRIFSMGCLLALSACGEPAPVTWNANLDVDCKPQDPLDKAYATLSTKKFWREQEYDMGTLKKAGEKNLSMSRTVLDDSRGQKGEYFQRAQKAARDLGLSGAAQRAHVKENMDRYDAEVKDIEMRIKYQENALSWVRKCTTAVHAELRKLSLSPVEYDPEKRPR
ncbi:exported hypothetical protein [Candidatus Terasakiella magnetica]|uniref:Lipoprotein n=1 Tax=Candidatus Terasakiella magnetica TaxID=1867952 RepID=A0A1C3RJ99_9PROT|nr:hypothetical protein [Candidatus Terasakiella magnetica]SCA57328.1 exported hypothetical protein [Candidatus Terasakiella magnetica]